MEDKLLNAYLQSDLPKYEEDYRIIVADDCVKIIAEYEWQTIFEYTLPDDFMPELQRALIEECRNEKERKRRQIKENITKSRIRSLYRPRIRYKVTRIGNHVSIEEETASPNNFLKSMFEFNSKSWIKRHNL